LKDLLAIANIKLAEPALNQRLAVSCYRRPRMHTHFSTMASPRSSSATTSMSSSYSADCGDDFLQACAGLTAKMTANFAN